MSRFNSFARLGDGKMPLNNHADGALRPRHPDPSHDLGRGDARTWGASNARPSMDEQAPGMAPNVFAELFDGFESRRARAARSYGEHATRPGGERRDPRDEAALPQVDRHGRVPEPERLQRMVAAAATAGQRIVTHSPGRLTSCLPTWLPR